MSDNGTGYVMPGQSPRPEQGETPPLWAPHYGISFGGAVKRFFRKYATFSGRASRSEYWWVTLFAFLVTLPIEAIYIAGGITSKSDPQTGDMTEPSTLFIVGAALLLIWAFAVFVPNLAISVRRLHDTGRSGWWLLIGFVPFIGGIFLLVLTLLDSRDDGARFDRPTS